jgi:hypothetical protein
MKREATTSEQRIADRFISLVQSKRAAIEATLNTGRAARKAQTWIDANGYRAALPVVSTAVDLVGFNKIAQRATLLEQYQAGLVGRSLGFRLTASGSDLDVLSETKTESTPPAFGIIWYIPIGAAVLIAAALSVAVSFYESAEKSREETKRRMAELDLAAAKAGGDVASRWETYKKDHKDEDGGFLGSLGKGLGGVAVAGAAILLIVLLSRSGSGSK